MTPNSDFPRRAVPRWAGRYFGGVAVLTMLTAMSRPAVGQLTPRNVSLQGLNQTGVDVRLVSAQAVPGVDIGSVSAKVLAALQQLGVTVVPNLIEPNDSTPVIRVVFGASSGTGSGGYKSIFVETHVRQRVTLNRNPSISPSANTWSVGNPPGSVLLGLEGTTINSLVDGQLSAFKADWNQANGRAATLSRVNDAQARWILDSCAFHSAQSLTDSGLFAQSVAADFSLLNVPALGPDANSILKDLETNSVASTTLPTAPPAGKWVKITTPGAATDLANKGWLVIGGSPIITPPEPGGQGLVAIVVANPAAGASDPPLAFWGRSGGNGRQNAPLSLAFPATQLATVVYYARKLGG